MQPAAMASRLPLCYGGIESLHGYGRVSLKASDTGSPVTQGSVARCTFYAQRPPSRRLLCVGETEPGDLWVRIQQAWGILVGKTTERQRVKQRFSNLLVKDRGFSATNLARLYNAAKGAIEQHVDLEQNEETEIAAYVERLGQVRLDFRVKRVKSVLTDEPYSTSVLDVRSTSNIESCKVGAEKRDEERAGVEGDQVDVHSAVVPDADSHRHVLSRDAHELPRLPTTRGDDGSTSAELLDI